MRREAIYGRRGWYPADRDELLAFLEEVMPEVPKGDPGMAARLIVAPHAGYRYSGRYAAAAFAATPVPDRAVLLTVVHRPRQDTPALGVWVGDAWETPLGDVPVDVEVVEHLLAVGAGYAPDLATHGAEHSGELQMPFLRYRNPSVRLTAIAVAAGDARGLVTAGEALASVLASLGEPAIIVASTDLSHEQETSPREVAARDRVYIERMLAIDPEGLHAAATRPGATMCGYHPTTLGLAAARGLGAREGRLLGYGTSAEVSGSSEYVVGYAGLVVR